MSSKFLKNAMKAQEDKATTQTLKPSQIECDWTFQAREEVDEKWIEDLEEKWRNGIDLEKDNPITVFWLTDEGKYVLVSGWHRLPAWKNINGDTEREFKVIEGTAREAKLYSFGVNPDRQKPLSDKEKNKIVEDLLRDEEWGQWSNEIIAEKAGVSSRFVGTVRNRIGEKREFVKIERNGELITMKVGNIGSKSKVKVTPTIDPVSDTPPAQAPVVSSTVQSVAPVTVPVVVVSPAVRVASTVIDSKPPPATKNFVSKWPPDDMKIDEERTILYHSRGNKFTCSADGRVSIADDTGMVGNVTIEELRNLLKAFDGGL